MWLQWLREGQGRSTDAETEVTKTVVKFFLVARDDIMTANCYKFVVIWGTEVGCEERCLSRKGGQV